MMVLAIHVSVHTFPNYGVSVERRNSRIVLPKSVSLVTFVVKRSAQQIYIRSKLHTKRSFRIKVKNKLHTKRSFRIKVKNMEVGSIFERLKGGDL